MIKKIVSGGQTGADQAALDAAIKWDILHGGWVPKGRITEAGRLPKRYHLKEMPTDSYPKRTEQNVIDSDGTLIITHGPLTGGLKFIKELAFKHNRPCSHIDLNKTKTFKAAKIVYDWITKFKIEILNVAGQRASKNPYIYQDVTKLLVTVFHMEVIITSLQDPHKASPFMPRTVEEAVDMFMSKIPLVGKTSIAKLNEHELTLSHPVIDGYIGGRFGMWVGNKYLLQSCCEILHKNDIHEDDVSAVIIKELWNQLKKTHALRVVK